MTACRTKYEAISGALDLGNPDSVVAPFDARAYEAKFDSQDTILSQAERLAKHGGGGTDCSLPCCASQHLGLFSASSHHATGPFQIALLCGFILNKFRR